MKFNLAILFAPLIPFCFILLPRCGFARKHRQHANRARCILLTASFRSHSSIGACPEPHLVTCVAFVHSAFDPAVGPAFDPASSAQRDKPRSTPRSTPRRTARRTARSGSGGEKGGSCSGKSGAAAQALSHPPTHQPTQAPSVFISEDCTDSFFGEVSEKRRTWLALATGISAGGRGDDDTAHRREEQQQARLPSDPPAPSPPSPPSLPSLPPSSSSPSPPSSSSGAPPSSSWGASVSALSGSFVRVTFEASTARALRPLDPGSQLRLYDPLWLQAPDNRTPTRTPKLATAASKECSPMPDSLARKGTNALQAPLPLSLCFTYQTPSRHLTTTPPPRARSLWTR